MAVICDDLKLLFICVPKTGSTSISQLLIDKFNGRWLPSNHVWDSSGTKIIVDYKHSTLRQLLQYNFLTSEQIQDFKIISFTRNPFDWVVSNYVFRRNCYKKYQRELGKNYLSKISSRIGKVFGKNKYQKVPNWIETRGEKLKETYKLEFDDYIVKNYYNKKVSVCEKYIQGAKVDILRMEEMQQNIYRVFEELSIENLPDIKHLNATKNKKSFSSYYSVNSRKIIEEAFENDFERFGYSFKE